MSENEKLQCTFVRVCVLLLTWDSEKRFRCLLNLEHRFFYHLFQYAIAYRGLALSSLSTFNNLIINLNQFLGISNASVWLTSQ